MCMPDSVRSNEGKGQENESAVLDQMQTVLSRSLGAGWMRGADRKSKMVEQSGHKLDTNSVSHSSALEDWLPIQ